MISHLLCKPRQHVRVSHKSTYFSNQVTQFFFLDDNVLQYGDIGMSGHPFELPVGDSSMTLDQYHESHRITAQSPQRREITHITGIHNVQPREFHPVVQRGSNPT